MASKKTKTNKVAEVNGVAAVPEAVSTAAEADAPVTGGKLRWTSLKAADGIAHRTKKPKAKKTGTTKTGTTKTEEDAAQAKKLSALDAAAKVLGETGQPMTSGELIEAMSMP